MSFVDGALQLFVEFARLYGVVLLAVTAVFVASCLFFEWLNRRHPEHKIQKNRTNTHMWKELRFAPGSIAMVSLCFSFGLFAQAKGWALVPLEASWWSVPLSIGLSVVLYDTWFYWGHRLGHAKAFYWMHQRHHQSPTPTPWTNHYETVADAVVYQLYYALIPFVLPIPAIALILHKLYDQVSGVLGHAGYEHFASPMARGPWPLASTVFHDQHHSGFNYNFAHTFSIWDRLMGTLHPRYDATVAAFEPGTATEA